jgi:predicted dehydrogenase
MNASAGSSCKLNTRASQVNSEHKLRAVVLGEGPGAERRTSLLTGLGIRPSRYLRDFAVVSPLPDVAFVCTPVESRLDVAARLLSLGIPALFIEQPVALSVRELNRLNQAPAGQIVMIGCNLRFAYDLPFSRWALIDIIAAKTFSPRLFGLLSEPGDLARLEYLIHELDLAYAINGTISSLHTIQERTGIRIGVEHRNMGWAQIELDWSGRPIRSAVVLHAHDDGAALRVPHFPERVSPAHDYIAQRKETEHFLRCIRTSTQPCCRMEDAEHVLRWALLATSKRRPGITGSPMLREQ